VTQNDSESSCCLSESLRFNDLHIGNFLLIPEQKVDNISTRREYIVYRNNNCEPASGQGKRWGKIATATKAVRAITAIVVFGIPVVTGAAILLGYGVHKLYERMTGRS
jgi:hypothetical protein